MSGETQPLDINADREAAQLVIGWGDGHVSTYSFNFLRSHCPCALCNHRYGPASERDNQMQLAPAQTDLKELKPVGRYAISVRWRDGHATGIYTFQNLREACPCPEHAREGETA